MNLGMGEILLLLALALVLFGAKRLPEVGRAVGSAMREFKRGLETGESPEKKENGEDGEPGQEK
ncbi:MAG: twin-arginine translocase TatA/TatE family subunit [Aminivibrio sp.]|jgi:sec-independent protein translocase protein TatA|nr:twin-arginine translocase TatA/TatE family subunit [Aminivibrio sp.]